MEKLTLDEMLINNQVAYGVETISRLVGAVNSIKESNNFENLTKHKQKQIMTLSHHLECALSSILLCEKLLRGNNEQ